MAVGDTHTIFNDSVRVVLTEHATYGIVLTSIENLIDGALQEFEEQSLFRVILRKVQIADEFFTLTADTATTAVIHGTEAYPSDAALGNLLVGEDPARGAREYFHADFLYDNVNSTTDDLTIHIYVNLLENEPERVLFSIIFDQDQGTGSQTMQFHGFFWAAPVLLKISPFASDQYINGMNSGLTTKDPQTDLVGNGTTYRFNVGTDFSGSASGTLDPATGFEPEAQASVKADRMELMYPTWMSSAMSGYADQADSGNIIYVHDNLHFKARRVLDWFDGTDIVLEHEALVENGIADANGWGDVIQGRVDTYVAVIKRRGDVLGEEIGLHYRKWALSSPDGQEIVGPKPQDCPMMGRAIQPSPIFRPYFREDDEYETGITEQIAVEFRMVFPALEDLDEHPLYRTNYDLVYEYNNDASGTLPGSVGNTSADLFAISADAGKITYAEELLDEYGLWTYGAALPRRPTPFDGRGYFLTDDMSGARCKNHHEAVAASYPTVQDYLHYSKTVASVTFSAGFTRIVLSAGAFDPAFWDIYSNYLVTTGGIDHALHNAHLGWFQKTDVSYAFPIEKQASAEAAFKADPPTIWVAGNRTATILVGHALDIHFVQGQYVPGYDRGSGLHVGTSLCGMADEIGNDGATSGGWATRFVEDFIAQCRPWMSGLLLVLSRLDQVCWGTHGGHVPGSNEQIMAWRKILRALRVAVYADSPDFQIWDEDGPYDWLIGRIDGHTRVSRRLDLTTTRGNWGQSPFFQTVWGDRYRAGGHLADREGHITNFNGPSVYEPFFIEPVEASKWREAMGADWTAGRLPSFGVYPVEDGQLGVRPDGQPAYTPFYHPTAGMTVDGSYAQFLAKLAQAHMFFEGVNVSGARVRSLKRNSTTLVDCNFMDGTGHGSWGAIGADENGEERTPLLHFVMRDHRNPRQLIAYFLNDYPSSTRASAYQFDPELYQDVIPLGGLGYKVTRYRAEHDGVEEVESKWAIGTTRFSMALDPSGVEMLVFDFSSGLNFIYAYDDEVLRSVPMPIDLTRHRVEDIHGAGERCIWGFQNELPDQDVAIAKVFLRIFVQGRSETQ